MEIRRLLHPLDKSDYTRSAIKALIPARYRQRLRAWLSPTSEVQWCRVVMNNEIERFIRSMDCSRLDVLEISGTGRRICC
jgi:hypothetical protein